MRAFHRFPRHSLLTTLAFAALCLAFIVPLVPQQMVRAQTTHIVTSSANAGPGSLRDAVSNATVGDTITFADNLTTIDLTEMVIIETDLTITGPGADLLTIQGDGSDRVLGIWGEIEVHISGITVSGGFSDAGGGGIAIQGPDMDNPATVTISDSVITGNLADAIPPYGGGGITSVDSNVTITNSTISDNTVTGSSASGGGIFNMQGHLRVINSTITNNTSSGVLDTSSGGGIGSWNGEVTIDRSTISGNTTSSESGTLVFGGGILTLDSDLTITNSTISDNTAQSEAVISYGGAIAALTSGIIAPNSVTITSSTIANNTADTSSALHIGKSAVTLQNSIVAGDPSATLCGLEGIAPGTITSLGYNLASDDSCFLTEETDLPETDPLLDDLAGNDGPTWTHAIKPASPAFDAGGAAPCVTATDQRGVERPQHQACDIGAFEFDEEIPDPPALTMPNDVTVEATGPAGAAVTFSPPPSATDWNGDELLVECDYDSGATIPIGVNEIECSATDSIEQMTSDTFTVTVQDTTPPDINVPGDMTVQATSPDGAIVDFAAGVTANDLVDPDPEITCTPPSGSGFQVGTTTVSCTATDGENNTSEPATFDITVLSADQMLALLIEDVRDGQVPAFLKTRLIVLLQTADRALERGQTVAACHTLAQFSSQVESLSPRYIGPALAEQLTDDAQRLRQAFGC